MARAIDRAGIQFRILNASKGPAVRATRAQADRVLYKRAIRELLDAAAEPHAAPAERRRPAARRHARARRRDADRHADRGASRRADGRHVPRRQDPRRPGELRGRPRGRPGVDRPRARAARSRPRGRPAEDRHAAAHRRPHASTTRASPSSPATSRRPVFSFLGRRAEHPRQVSLPHHAHDGAHARDHPRGARPLAALHGRDRGRRPALLPVDRGQGGALRGPHAPPDLHRARGPRRRSRSIRTASRRRCRSTCSSSSCARFRASSTRTSRGPATRSSTTSSIRATSRPRSRRRRSRGSVLRRPDQRHDGLRGGRGAGHRRRHQRGPRGARAASRGRRAATRPTSAC